MQTRFQTRSPARSERRWRRDRRSGPRPSACSAAEAPRPPGWRRTWTRRRRPARRPGRRRNTGGPDSRRKEATYPPPAAVRSFLGLCGFLFAGFALGGSLALGGHESLRGRDFLFDLHLALLDDLDHELLRVDEHCHALGHFDVRDAKLRLDLLERREVHLEGLGNVGRKAFDPKRVDGLQNIGVATLDGGRLTHQVHRHLDGDLLFEVDLVEVDVDRSQAARMRLDLAYENLLRLVSTDDEVDKVGPPGLHEHLLELETVEDQRRRLGVVPVDDRGELALAVKPA